MDEKQMNPIEYMLLSIPLLPGSVVRNTDTSYFVLFEKGTSWVTVEATKETIEEYAKRFPEKFSQLWCESGQLEGNGLKFVDVKIGKQDPVK